MGEITEKARSGLKRGDIISYPMDSEDQEKFKMKKCLGVFDHKKETKIYAYWQIWETGEFSNYLSYMQESDVTFEFRPKFEED